MVTKQTFFLKDEKQLANFARNRGIKKSDIIAKLSKGNIPFDPEWTLQELCAERYGFLIGAIWRICERRKRI